MNIPSTIVAGDSASWSDSSFSSSGRMITSVDFSLMYCLRGPGAALDLSGSGSGSGWTVAITTAQSAQLNTTAAPVQWFWQAFASKAGQRVVAGEGTLLVKPNFAALTGTVDGRTQTERDYEAVTAAISARISGDAVQEYTVYGRQLKKEPIAELIKLQDRLRSAINRQRAQQKIANGQGNPGKTLVRFGRV